MKMPPIVSPQEWQSARDELLVKEKELTRARDALAAERRRMPRMAVDKDYRFEGPNGPASLLDLFEGRRQLILYRFFFEPGVAGWPEGGCRGCSFMADEVRRARADLGIADHDAEQDRKQHLHVQDFIPGFCSARGRRDYGRCRHDLSSSEIADQSSPRLPLARFAAEI